MRKISSRSRLETFTLSLQSCLPNYLQIAIFGDGLEPTYKGLKLLRRYVQSLPQQEGLEPTYKGLKLDIAREDRAEELPVWSLPIRD